jgi:hypothetical protein
MAAPSFRSLPRPSSLLILLRALLAKGKPFLPPSLSDINAASHEAIDAGYVAPLLLPRKGLAM